MIHIGSAHEFLARRKGGKNFLLHFYATIFQKISISEKYNLEKNMNWENMGKFNDFLAPFPEYWQCTCTACTVVFGAPVYAI